MADKMKKALAKFDKVDKKQDSALMKKVLKTTVKAKKKGK